MGIIDLIALLASIANDPAQTSAPKLMIGRGLILQLCEKSTHRDKCKWTHVLFKLWLESHHLAFNNGWFYDLEVRKLFSDLREMILVVIFPSTANTHVLLYKLWLRFGWRVSVQMVGTAIIHRKVITQHTGPLRMVDCY